MGRRLRRQEKRAKVDSLQGDGVGDRNELEKEIYDSTDTNERGRERELIRNYLCALQQKLVERNMPWCSKSAKGQYLSSL